MNYPITLSRNPYCGSSAKHHKKAEADNVLIEGIENYLNRKVAEGQADGTEEGYSYSVIAAALNVEEVRVFNVLAYLDPACGAYAIYIRRPMPAARR